MRVLVTGATGFVGSALLPELRSRGWQVRAATRGPVAGLAVETVAVGDIGEDTGWSEALEGVRAVVHLAAHVHPPGRDGPDGDAVHFRVNAAGTGRLAEAAVAAGVRRFVFVSSVKAVADGGVVTDGSPPRPGSAYGRSKLEGERALERIAGRTGMEAVVLRPPLVYGPGVGANFLRLLRACRRGLPLPLGAVRNRRSLIHVANLADAVATCLSHPRATGHRFLVHDGPTPSTPELVAALRASFGLPPRLVPVPPALLRAGLLLLGRADAYERLAGSLALDDARFRKLTGWSPPLSQDRALDATARWFAERARGLDGDR
jgi:nucleoside-diphosphate-sugar epimerase